MTQEVTRELVELADVARASLTSSDWSRLRDFTNRVNAHDGPFAEHVPPKHREDGALVIGYTAMGPLIRELLPLAYDLKLVVPFAWPEWEEGRQLINSEPFDAATLTWAQTVGLFTALIRGDRFSEGSLAQVFGDGRMPRLMVRLLDFAPEGDEAAGM